MSEQPTLPSKMEMALNLTDSVKEILKKAVTAGQVLVSEDVARKRLEVCLGCDKFIAQPEGSVIPYRCSVCGCGMKVKSRLAAMSCPLNKWGPV